MTTTTNNNNTNRNEISFWKIVKNKLLLKNILRFLSYDEYKERWYHDEGSNKNNFASSPTHSIQYLVDNQLKNQLKHKILNDHYLVLGKCSEQHILQMFKDDDMGEEYTCEFYRKLFIIMEFQSDLLYKIVLSGNFNALKYYCDNKPISYFQSISSSILAERFGITIWFLNKFKETHGRNFFGNIKQLKVIDINKITIYHGSGAIGSGGSNGGDSNNGTNNIKGYLCLNLIFSNIEIPNYRLKKSTNQLFTMLKENLFKKCPLSLNFTIECLLESCKSLAYINRIITRSKYLNIQLESLNIDTTSDTEIIEYINTLYPKLTDEFKQKQILTLQIQSSILPILKYFSKSVPLDKTLFQIISGNCSNGTMDEVITVLSNDLNYSFKYGSFEIFKNWYDETEKRYSNRQDTQKEMDSAVLTVKSPTTHLTEFYRKESLPKLFSHCIDDNGGFENKIIYIDQVCHSILQDQQHSKYQINPLYFFSLVVELDNMELIEFTFNKLKSKLGVNKSSIQTDGYGNDKEDLDDRPNKRLKSENGDKVLDKLPVPVSICSSVCLCSNVNSIPVLKFIYKHFSESNQHWKTDKWRITGRMDLIEHFETMVPANHKFSYSFGYYGFKSHQLSYLSNAISKPDKYQVANDKLTIFFAIDPSTTDREMDNIKYVIKNTNTVYRLISGMNESPSHRLIEFSNWWLTNSNELKPRKLQFPYEDESSTFNYISGKFNLVDGLISEFIEYHFGQTNYSKSWFDLAEKNADLYILDAVIKRKYNQLGGNGSETQSLSGDTITFRFLKFLLSSVAWDNVKLVQYLYTHHSVFFEELVDALIFLSVERNLHQVFKYFIDIGIIDVSKFNFDQSQKLNILREKLMNLKNNIPIAYQEESEDEDEPLVAQDAATDESDNSLEEQEDEEDNDGEEMVQEQNNNNNGDGDNDNEDEDDEEGSNDEGVDGNDEDEDDGDHHNLFNFHHLVSREYDFNFQYFDSNRKPIGEKENVHKIINSKKGWFNDEALNFRIKSFIFKYYTNLVVQE